jgi:crotonobetainyl-CoA:carnitine CoA-transferase CaiB-like acyl-CoA transferase
MQITGLEAWLDDPRAAMTHRDAIKTVIGQHVAQRSTAAWLAILQPADIWCAEVLDWPALMESAAFQGMDFLQRIGRDCGLSLSALRSPLRVNGQVLKSERAAPGLGQDTDRIVSEFALDASGDSADEIVSRHVAP